MLLATFGPLLVGYYFYRYRYFLLKESSILSAHGSIIMSGNYLLRQGFLYSYRTGTQEYP